ncbi:Ldh family oxidoreductase [Paroceanicella profunda]|uniref:Ldh family oxidoreductase n=1 Tax=Paroceanicella profunda TaxID=2579971 RepID=A0A5B8FI95_9RHOB|nr:Ldh family oxidoreductase [Paroceanicella profunda]QDL92987.1 Ldh family oxidoreductase [Paroceanicella profunda]
MSDIVLSLAEAESLANAALVASRTLPENAAPVARALVRAEADGQHGHGLSRIPSYTAQSRSGKVDGAAVPRVEDIRPGAFRVDAGHGFAYPALDLALPELVRRAGTQGIACATLVHSHHFGVAGLVCEQIAEAGCVGFIYGNAPKAMAPWGAKTPVLGTNPIAFAAPVAGAPALVIDLATSQVARGKILAARESGTAIPQGWALDRDGAPTTDPVEALAGTVAPMGGAKGAALALMVEVMAACVAGAALASEASSLFDGAGAPPDLGQVLIALDAQALSGGLFASRMQALLAAFAAAEGARLPGSRRLEARARSAREGLALPRTLVDRIKEIAAT